MAHALRFTAEQYSAYQARRARECAEADFASGAVVDTDLRGSTPRTETNSDAGPAFRESAAVVRGASRVRPASEPRVVSLLLPWPPSKNRLYYHGTHFRTVTYRKFCAEVHGIVTLVGAKPFLGEVHVQLDCYPPSNLGDVANMKRQRSTPCSAAASSRTTRR